MLCFTFCFFLCVFGLLSIGAFGAFVCMDLLHTIFALASNSEILCLDANEWNARLSQAHRLHRHLCSVTSVLHSDVGRDLLVLA